MKTNPNGSALIVAFEGMIKLLVDGRVTTYYCPAGVLTIGLGTTRSDVPDLQPGDIWTQERARDVFAESLGKYEAGVEKLNSDRVRSGKPAMTGDQFAALVSFAYNCGVGALSGSVGRAVREGRDADVPECLSRWNKGGGKILAGLVRRRKAEGQLYSGDVAGAMATAGTAVPVQTARTRETPKPTAGELARRTPGLAGGAAAGGGTSSGTVANKTATEAPSAPKSYSSTEMALIGVGIAVAIVCTVIMLRKWGEMKKDWA